MRVLLVSTYELGHQPLHVASPAAALLAAGHQVRGLDLAVDDWDPGDLAWAQAVAFSVPMHTAMRLAVAAARALRAQRPGVPICLYGLYAPVSSDTVVAAVADRAIAGEYEPALVAWVDDLAGAGAGVAGAGAAGGLTIELGRAAFLLPARHLLAPLDRYARLELGGERRLVGYLEASHGCAHRCRHCPVPAVYGGRTRALDEDLVVADAAQLVAMGARHLTFGDPDFLNRPRHCLRVASSVHAAFPELTFDCTVKVEHILRHDGIWAEMAGLGCLFVVSAFESVDDATLARLDKGHTTADAARAVSLLGQQGIEIRPSFMPFTPWTTVGQLVDLVDFVAAHDLVPNVDPVQYAIRLLVPEGSLLLDRADLVAHLDGYDAEALTWIWRHLDPRVDALQQELSALAAAAAANGEAVEDTYVQVRRAVAGTTGAALPPARRLRTGSTEGRPRLTEPWFC